MSRRRKHNHSAVSGGRRSQSPSLVVLLGWFCVVVALGAGMFHLHFVRHENQVDASMSLVTLVLAGILAVVFFAGHFCIGRKERLWAGRRQEFPNEPWKWWPGWRSGMVQPRVNARVYYWWFATGCVAGLFLGWLQDVLRKEFVADGAKVFVVVLGVATLVLAGLAMNMSWRWWRGRKSFLRLITFPVPRGGRMEAMVTLPFRLRPAGGFQLRLLQIKRKLVTHRRGSTTEEEELQRVEVAAQAMETGPEAAHSTTVPVSIQLPPEALGGDPDPGDYGYHWRLQVRAEIPGENLLAEFPVPVFGVPEK